MGTALGNSFRQMRDGPDEPRVTVCPDCWKQVSKVATTCPHCGRPLKREEEKKTSTLGIAAAVVIGILVAVWILSKVMHIEITGTIMPIK